MNAYSVPWQTYPLQLVDQPQHPISVRMTTYRSSNSSVYDLIFNASDYAPYGHHQAPRLMDRLEVKIIFGIIMCALCFITTLGNICVIYRYRRTSSVGNLFIISLAIADLIVGSFVMPLASVYAITETWNMPLFVCQIWLSADYSASTSSILNLLTLSLDRYWSITSPLEYLGKRTKSRALFMISLAWSISVLWVLPIIGWAHFFNDGVRLVPPDKCNTEYDKNILFKMATAICNFYIPLIAMISINTKIYLVIRKRYDNPVMDPNGEFGQKGGCQYERRPGPFDNLLLEWLWNIFSCYKNKKQQQHQQQQQQSQMVSQARTNDVTINQSTLVFKRSSFDKPSQSSSVTKTSRYNQLSRTERNRLQANEDDDFSLSLSTASNTCNKHAFSMLRRQDSQQNPNCGKPGASNANSNSKVKFTSPCYRYCCGGGRFSVGRLSGPHPAANSSNTFQSTTNVHSDVQITVKYSKAGGELAKSASFKLNRLSNSSKSSKCSGERSISRMYQERCKLPDNSIRITRLIDSSGNTPGATATATTPGDGINQLNSDDLSRISPIYSKPDPRFFEANVNLIQVLNATYGEESKELEPDDKPAEPVDSNNNNLKEEDNSSGSSKNRDGVVGESEINNNAGAKSDDASSRTAVKKLSDQSHSKPFLTKSNSSKSANFKSTLTLESRANARKGFMNKQEKAFKQLGAIVIGFTLCFLPYFIVFLIVAICEDCVNEDIFTLTVWLGYLNSTINPFLYALSNKKYIRSIRARSIFGRRNARKVKKPKKPATSKDAPLA